MHHFRTFSQTQGTSFTASTKMWSVEQQLKRSFEMLKRLVLLPVPRGRSHNARRNKARWCVSALLLFFFPGSLNFFAWNWLCSYFPRTTHQSSEERERGVLWEERGRIHDAKSKTPFIMSAAALIRLVVSDTAPLRHTVRIALNLCFTAFHHLWQLKWPRELWQISVLYFQE